MAKRGKKYRKRPSKKIPLAAASGVGVAVARPIQTAISGNPMEGLFQFFEGMTGFHPAKAGWNPFAMSQGTLPIMVGALVSYGASKLGLNNYLRNIPLVKV
jgi:hypothetical protein